MWNSLRETNDPEYTGYVVEAKTKCGKKNCRCYRKNSPHKAYWLMWREYTGFGTRILKKKYLSKYDAYFTQRKLAINKGSFLFAKLNLQEMGRLHQPMSSQFEDTAIETYLKYGGSRMAKKILDDGKKYLYDVGIWT